MRILDHRGHEIEVTEEDKLSVRDLHFKNTIHVSEAHKLDRLKRWAVNVSYILKWIAENPQNLMRWAFIYIFFQVFFGNLQPSEILKSQDFKDFLKVYKQIKP